MTSTTARGWLGHYLPALVVAVAIPTFVALVPSEPQDRSFAAGVGPTTSGGSGQITGTTTPGSTASAPGALDGGAGGAGGGAVTGGETPAGAPWRILDAPADCFLRQAGFDRCPGGFEGDNGGSTYPGVTADAINIVYYEPKRDDQVDAILGAAGEPSADDIRRLLEAWEEFANRAYGFYGRRVNVIYQQGPGADSDPAQQQADATRVAVEHDAFAVVSEAATRAFYDEASRRGVINVNLLSQFEPEYYQQRAPFHWGVLPDLDLILDHVAEYWCGRLMGRPADHAGPGLRGQPRRLGVVHSESNDAGARLARAVERCGGSVTKVVQYADDITTATQQATNIIAQMRSAGVTTVTCVCDPVTPIFITAAADAQAYNPEWLHNGYLATDSYQAGRFYTQTQWARSFGPSSLDFPGPIASRAGWKAYVAVRPEGSRGPAQRAEYLYGMLEIVFGGIEAAGPILTPQNFADGLSNPEYNPPPSSPNEIAFSFGPGGPSPYTGVDNTMEIWWDPNRTGPDGEKGSPFFVRSGERYDLGEWPNGAPNVFRDDGSPQPGRDPDQQ